MPGFIQPTAIHSEDRTHILRARLKPSPTVVIGTFGKNGRGLKVGGGEQERYSLYTRPTVDNTNFSRVGQAIACLNLFQNVSAVANFQRCRGQENITSPTDSHTKKQSYR